MEVFPVYMKENSSVEFLSKHPSESSGNDVFSCLYPAIVQCFTIILLGYVTGRGGWITKSHEGGLSTFTSTFALPALLFSNMATLDWSKVEWTFIAAIFTSKAVLFMVVLAFSLLLQRPSNSGLAALCAIFATQSNDFALGYPIVKAIYGETQPQFLQYIYLLAPISLVLLNPIGFAILEFHKLSSTKQVTSKCSLVIKVVKEIVTNPIIIMTALGVVANFIFQHKLPLILDNVLSTLGQSFSACALFILGLNIVGKFNRSMKSLLMGSSLLIFAKLLLFPMMTMGFSWAFNCGHSVNSTAQYSMFAFLYGTFPTAPSVFIYSTQYAVGKDLIATSLVLGTVISAPLMFTSAMGVGMQILAVDERSLLDKTSLDVAVLSLICSVAVVLLFAVTKRICRMPQLMIPIIAFFQMLLAIGVIIDTSNDESATGTRTVSDYVKFIMYCVGLLGVSTMMSVCAATIYLISCHSLCRSLVWRPFLLCYGLGLPVLVVAAILMLGEILPTQSHDPKMFGFPQLALTLVPVTLLLNIMFTIFILIMRQRRARGRGATSNSPNCSESGEAKTSLIGPMSTRPRGYGSCSKSSSVDAKENVTESNEAKKPLLSNIEDMVPFPDGESDESIQDVAMCSAADECSAKQIDRCKVLLEKYDSATSDSPSIEGHQLGRMTVLLVVLLFSQTMVIFYYGSRVALTTMRTTGLIVEIEFIYIVFGIGQGFFTFVVFGLDSELVIIPAKRLLLRLLPVTRRDGDVSGSLSSDTTMRCQQFTTHHLAHCQQSLQRLHRAKQDCFSGAAVVSWLISTGLAADSAESQLYAAQLLKGGVIKSCSKRSINEFFDTKRHIYQFG